MPSIQPHVARSAPSMQALLSLAPDGPDEYRAEHLQSNPGGTVFGGVLIGQALAAAGQQLDGELQVHHLQLTFLAAGQMDGPALRYQVTTVRAGRSFTTRHVTGWQGERQIVSAEVSFQRPELGPSYQAGPQHRAPDPQTIPTLQEMAPRLQATMGKAAMRLMTPGPAELRMVDAETVLTQRSQVAALRYWVRLGESLPDDPALQAAALGYLSDLWFPLTAMLPHLAIKLGHGMQVTSLNHAIWFHRPARGDEWLWVEAESPGSASARGLSIGRVYDRGGQLVATLAQENLFRGWVRNDNGELVPPRAKKTPTP